ncbi:unnamed protein product, partial [Polarella glacialis]
VPAAARRGADLKLWMFSCCLHTFPGLSAPGEDTPGLQHICALTLVVVQGPCLSVVVVGGGGGGYCCCCGGGGCWRFSFTLWLSELWLSLLEKRGCGMAAHVSLDVHVVVVVVVVV